MHWRAYFWALVATFVCCAVLLGLWKVASPDDSQYGFKYVTWKWGIGRYETRLAEVGLFSDHAFQESLIGQEKSDLFKKFPNLKAPDKANKSQAYYKIDAFSSNCMWLGESQWCFLFDEQDKLIKIGLYKG